jgi:ribose-phosphate pyrophosphokinase
MAAMKLFAGRAHPLLAQKVSDYLGIPLGAVRISEFPDGETFVKVEEDIRGKDVFFLHPTCAPVPRNLMELLIFADCARRASASRVTAVIPYFGFARQDRKDEGRVPITAKLAANLLTAAGVSRVLTMDLHAAQIQGFFDIPVDNLYAEPVLSRYWSQLKLENLVLVSPDVGNVKTARIYAERLGGDLAIIDKRRLSGSEIETGRLIGSVKDKNVLMMDDMISTAGTVCSAARLCMDQGAARVFIGATHAVLCGPAVERLADAPIEQVVVTDTVPVSQETTNALGKLKVLSISALLGEAIHRIHNDESVSSLFQLFDKSRPPVTAGQ